MPADASTTDRMGLPEEGVGSVAGFGRRLAALFVDWVSCLLVTSLLTRGSPAYGSPDYSAIVLVVFFVEVTLLTWLIGASFGQRLLGLAVASVTGRPLGPGRAAFRTLLLCLVVPAVIWDHDGRGLHDRASGAVVVRAR